jgi:predicted O-methyltransferase YrrM
MPIVSQGNIHYSTAELAERLRIPTDQVVSTIAQAKLKPQHIDDKWSLPLEQVKEWFGQFLSLDGHPAQYHIPNSLRTANSPWARTLVQMYENEINFPAAVSPEQGEFLHSLTCNIAPQQVVEVGCFTGISTVWIASALEQIGSAARIDSVDLFYDIFPFPPYRHNYLANPLAYAERCVSSAGLSERVRFHQMASQEMGMRYSELIKEPIDLLYLDGDHSIRGCRADFLLFYPYLRPGGYLILHDINPDRCGDPGPRHVIDHYIKGSRHFELIEVDTKPLNYGMALIRKKSDAPKTVWTRKALMWKIQYNAWRNQARKPAVRPPPPPAEISPSK